MDLYDDLRRNKHWIYALGTDGHSGDESDHKSSSTVRYVIQALPWRSDEVTQYVRALDAVHMSTKFTISGRPIPGAWPRTRVLSKKSVDTCANAVPGLPRNFYNPAWLADQEEWRVRMLQIKEVTVDLTLQPLTAQ